MKRLLVVLVGFSLTCSTVRCFAEEIRVYRLQLGAYNTLQEAEAKADEVHAFIAEQDVNVEDKGSVFPFKVRTGWYSTYEEAKNVESQYESLHGAAFVVSEEVSSEQLDVLRFSLSKPTKKVETKSVSMAEGMLEVDLISSAEDLVRQAKENWETMSRVDRNALLKQAQPYLEELAESYPISASASWARHALAVCHHQDYYIARYERLKAKRTILSSTEEYAQIAAIAEFKRVVLEYPDSPYAEDAAYEIAACKYEMKQAGGAERKKDVIQAYEDFLQRYPKSLRAGRAQMVIASLKFELAKTNLLPMQEAYANLESVLDCSETLDVYSRGRTLLMMAEIQQFHFQDIAASLDVLGHIDTGPSQDLKTAASAIYLTANGKQALGDYEQAAGFYRQVLEEFPNDASFNGLDLHPICLYALGDCQIALKDWDGARQTFQKLKEEWPNDVRAENYDKMLEWIERERSAK